MLAFVANLIENVKYELRNSRGKRRLNIFFHLVTLSMILYKFID